MMGELLVTLRASYHFKVGFFLVFPPFPSTPLPTPVLRLACATPIFVIPLHPLVVVIPPRRIRQPVRPLSSFPSPSGLHPLICLPLPSSSSPRRLPHLRSPPHSQASLHYPYVICLFAFVYCIACSCTCIMLCCHLCHPPPSAHRHCHSHPSAHLFAAAVIAIPRGLPAPRLPTTCSFSGQPALPLCYLLLYFCLVYCIACTCIMLCRRHPTPSARRRCHSPNAPSSGPVGSSLLSFPWPPSDLHFRYVICMFALMFVYCISCTCTCIMLCINFPFSFFQ